MVRRLLYAPIIHTESDLGSVASALDRESASLCGEERWSKHKETVAKLWESIANYFAGIDPSRLKIYQDGLPAEGELGRKILAEAAKRGSKNHQLVLDLLERGAEIRKTEDPTLLQEEYKYITGLLQPPSAASRDIAGIHYKSRKRQLTRERDKFVARTIAETLQEGETGVLFMGSYHNILPHLPRDIRVEQVKEREKVNAYFREMVSPGEGKRLEQLAEYLAAPCPG